MIHPCIARVKDLVWNESDSLLVMRAFNLNIALPWPLRNRWRNFKVLARSMHTLCTNIQWEGNSVVDALAKNGQVLPSFSSQLWSAPPFFLDYFLARDNMGLPFLRFAYV